MKEKKEIAFWALFKKLRYMSIFFSVARIPGKLKAGIEVGTRLKECGPFTKERVTYPQ